MFVFTLPKISIEERHDRDALDRIKSLIIKFITK